MKKCRTCQTRFEATRPFQTWCSPECGAVQAIKKQAKAKAKQAACDRRQTKARLEVLKTRSDWIKDAQAAFNRYIRLRDAGKPCICCGEPLGASSVGGDFDCGHYRSVGSAPNLRFDERNAHGQRKQCNRWGSGRAVDYRRGLIARIGIEAVEALESDQQPRHWSIDDLRTLRDHYRAKARELEKDKQ